MSLKSEIILSLEAPFRDSVEIHRLRFGDPSSGVLSSGRHTDGEETCVKAFVARSGVLESNAGDFGEEAMRVVLAPRLAGV